MNQFSGKFCENDYILVKFAENLNTLVAKFTHFSGRKFSIEDVKQKLNVQLKDFMRLKPDTFYENCTVEELQRETLRLGEDFDINNKQLRSRLKSYHRNRYICCWHDTSSISNHSHLLITFSCMYDKALFYTDAEYYEKTGNIDIVI